MTMKEEYKLECHQTHKSEFSPLWKIMASSFRFMKILKQDIDKYPKWHIINTSQQDTHIILTDKLYEFGSLFIIKDSFNDNRYFIGFTFHAYYTIHNATGIFVYFNQHGQSDQYKICTNILWHYDHRNGKCDDTNTCLFNQSLVFGYIHRDTGTLFMFVNYLSYDDEIIAQTKEFDTDIHGIRFNSKNNAPKYNRFYYIFSKEKNHILFDLGSLGKINNNDSDNYKIDKYIITPNDNDDNKLELFFNDIENIPICEYNDGYPEKCIKCNQATISAIYYHDNSSCNLGNSYCNNCNIRYSQSYLRWECCKCISYSNDNYYMCNKPLNNNNYECDEKTHMINIKFKYNFAQPSLKYPFRKHADVTSSIKMRHKFKK